MKERGAGRTEPQVLWHEEKGSLTLEGEPVLEYTLSWPEVQNAGLSGRWISRYYDRLARSWKQRWQREVYLAACLSFAQKRERSRPFQCWTGRLGGEVTALEGGLLSIRLEGEEIRGDGKPCRVTWGDVWKVREGRPEPLKRFFPGERRWKGRLTTAIREQGEARQTGGDCFLDQGWEKYIGKLLPSRDFWLQDGELAFAFPQCAIAPAAEGTPVFRFPLAEREERPEA
ncbi:RsiV family protein [Lawsonibacter sp. OA9]|uniref:DUF3298 domain-containing protein n=1 Tax=Flintibacter hominis TaxID=2763048 RepID=A0A8J6MC72_9FIRM|nr:MULTISPECIES: RsiV family protein [Eubacteriales]SCH26596.1 Protein of uncharacterised function (DUF3298) [uncultured Clostridium sp.]SCI55568.1 Protein of uncharacterised function (DUF3298) [uncultured Flavonifractor sp.]MBC5721536.1 DUF3298 domain-containing protein [Flintibacter hominis]MCH1980144.1 RsiV family protein [Lawsonibacter sp. OA9]MCU6701254.1 RsiV family protein [Muriventricola aceti]